MENIYIDMREQGFTLSNHFKNKDMVSVEDLLTELENTLEKIDCLQEEFDDYKEITLQNCIDNEKHYEFNCDGDKQEITMILREENNE